MKIILLFLLIIISKSVQNIINKESSDKTSVPQTSFFLRLVPVVLSLPVLLYLDILTFPSNFILGLSILAGVLIAASTIFLVKSYNTGEVSVVTPFYSLNPIFGGIFSWIIIGEELSATGILGVGLICIGAYTIKVNNLNSILEPFKKLLKDKGIIYMILFTITLGITSPIDSIASNTISPFLWLFYAGLFTSIFLLIVLSIREENWKQEIIGNNVRSYAYLFLVGFSTFILASSMLFAYQYTKVAFVLSIFMLNIVVTSIIGIIVYDEPLTYNKIISILVMTTGGIIIVLS